MTLASILQEVTTTCASVDQVAIDAVVEGVRSARAVTLTGQGRSGLIAQMTAMRLMHLGIEAHATGEATAPRVGEGDLLIAVSGSGGTTVTVHFAETARAAGARVASLVRSKSSPLGELSDYCIEVPSPAPSVQPGGSMFEQSALLSLDAVVLGCAAYVSDVRSALAARHTNLQ